MKEGLFWVVGKNKTDLYRGNFEIISCFERDAAHINVWETVKQQRSSFYGLGYEYFPRGRHRGPARKRVLLFGRLRRDRYGMDVMNVHWLQGRGASAAVGGGIGQEGFVGHAAEGEITAELLNGDRVEGDAPWQEGADGLPVLVWESEAAQARA